MLMNPDLIGFVPRPIPMKPRLGGFVGMKKWVLCMGLIPIPKTHTHETQIDGFHSQTYTLETLI